METLPLPSLQAFSALQLLRNTAPRLASDFAGLGIVSTTRLRRCRTLRLEVGGDERFDLPVFWAGTDLRSVCANGASVIGMA